MDEEFKILGVEESIERVNNTLQLGQIYVNNSGRRFEVDKLDEELICLVELNDLNEKIGYRNWNRKTFAHALRNKIFDKAINKSKDAALLVRRLNINELMR